MAFSYLFGVVSCSGYCILFNDLMIIHYLERFLYIVPWPSIDVYCLENLREGQARKEQTSNLPRSDSSKAVRNGEGSGERVDEFTE